MELEYKEIEKKFEELKMFYAPRNAILSILRYVYGHINWTNLLTQRDLSEPEMKYNLLRVAVDRFVDFSSTPPTFSVIKESVEEKAIKFADNLEKFLVGVWQANKIIKVHLWTSFYQSLFGMFCIGIVPRPSDERKILIQSMIPEYCLPEWMSEECTEMKSFVYAYKKYSKDYLRHSYRDNTVAYKNLCEANIINYWDKEHYHKIDTEFQKTIVSFKHDLGFIPYVFGQGKTIPHSDRGGSDIENAVTLNVYMDDLRNFAAKIVEDCSDIPLVVKGTLLSDIDKDNIFHVQEGGDVHRVETAGPPMILSNLLRATREAIEDTTNVPMLTFGRRVVSGTSGKAVERLMSGFEARLYTKNMALGEAYQDVNKFIFKEAEKVYPNEELQFAAVRKGKGEIGKLKGKDINGYYFNQVNWTGGPFSEAAKVARILQLKGARLISRHTAREELNIQSPGDEEELVKQEMLSDIEFKQEMTERGGKPGVVDKDQRTIDKGGLPGGMAEAEKMTKDIGKMVKKPGRGTFPPAGATPSPGKGTKPLPELSRISKEEVQALFK